MSGTLLSIGHGYVAQALARRLLPQGWRIIGTTRSRDKAATLAEGGVEAAVWPGDDLSEILAAATHVLSSVAPLDRRDPVVAALSEELRTADLRWVGYLSTTGVYGDRGGDWVDEGGSLDPASPRGAARVAAEAEWRALGLPLHIFRLPGIYGAGRSALDRLRAGDAHRVIKPGQVFSRAHVDDIAQVLAASIARPRPGAIYNVADDEPSPPQDVIAHAARLLGVPPPAEVPFDEADMSPMARSFYSESKRVSNDLIKRELGVRLLYPTYREGLAAILATERS